MKSIIKVVVLAAAVGGGAIAADVIKSSASGDTSHSDEPVQEKAKGDGHKADSDHGDKKEKKGKDSHGKSDKKDAHGKKGGKDDHGKKAESATTFVKFSRQFVVPVIGPRRVQSLIILDINLDVTPDMYDSAYQQQPRLRAALMSQLLAMSHDGLFDQDMTSLETQKKITDALKARASEVLGDGLKEVIILEMSRQDQ